MQERREIKFRGKRLDDGEWAYGFIYLEQYRAWIVYEEGFQSKPNDVHGPAEWDTEPTWYEVNPETVGQLTGLKDHTGIEIYEGDIIEHGNGDRFKVEDITPPRKEMYYEYEHYDDFLSMSDVDYEVIGNVYENPELLK